MKILIVPAIIAKKPAELSEMLEKVKGKVKRIQLDVMDGKFVPNISLNFDLYLDPSFEYEAHLMIENPLTWIEKNAEKVELVTMHVEPLQDVRVAIDFVKKRGVKVGLALIPSTKIEVITPFLDDIDEILIMTVEPGSYCVKKEFRPEPLNKIRSLRKINKTIPIEVDGCMNPTNAKLARDSGANIFASGSYIFKSKNINASIRKLEDAVKD